MSKARDLANAGTALTTVSATELGYLDGVTSAVQTQINSKIGQSTAINPTIVDAKGDIIAASAADTVARLAVGANDTVLTADSSTATGLKWSTPASGGMTLLSTTTLSGTTTTISSINQSYKDLYVVLSNPTCGGNGRIRCLPNNAVNLAVSNAVYTSAGSTVTEARLSEYVFFSITNADGTGGVTAGALRITNYASTTARKPFSLNGIVGVSSTVQSQNQFGALNTTSAITSLVFENGSGSAWTGGTVTVYGVA